MDDFAGTGSLLRLAARRDRVRVPIWLAVFAMVAATSASATVGLYPQEAERIQAAESFNHAQSLVALYGRVYDPTSIGALAMVKLGGIGAVFVALLTVFLVARHTRADEETGRLELLGATVVGRKAALAAALLWVGLTNVALAGVTALGLVAAGLPGDGSFCFGLAWGGVGLAFGGIAAIAAQLATSARAATAASALVLGVVYVARAVGDAAGDGALGWLTWLSPIGWGQQFRPYAGNRWWVLLITLGFAALATIAAFAIVVRRDMGAGLLPVRPGPAIASPRFASPLALAWRLQRTALFGWLAGFVLLGGVLGNLASNLGDFFSSPQARDFILKLGGEKALTDAYLAMELGITAVIAAAYGVQAAMHLRSEETSLRLEPLLATATTRTRWLLSHTLIALAGVTALMVGTGLAAGLAYGARTSDASQVTRVLGAALVHVPAAWVLTGVVVAAVGWAPRWAAAGWAALAAFIVLGEIGPLLQLDQWVMDFSPFAHVPLLPGAPFSSVPVAVLAVIALTLIWAGVVGFRRRDVPVA